MFCYSLLRQLGVWQSNLRLFWLQWQKRKTEGWLMMTAAGRGENPESQPEKFALLSWECEHLLDFHHYWYQRKPSPNPHLPHCFTYGQHKFVLISLPGDKYTATLKKQTVNASRCTKTHHAYIPLPKEWRDINSGHISIPCTWPSWKEPSLGTVFLSFY